MDIMLDYAKRMGEDLEDETYVARLRAVWETRDQRIRGFKDVPSSMPGECGLCYRENVPLEGVHVCEHCKKDPRRAEIAKKLEASKKRSEKLEPE